MDSSHSHRQVSIVSNCSAAPAQLLDDIDEAEIAFLNLVSVAAKPAQRADAGKQRSHAFICMFMCILVQVTFVYLFTE